MNASIIASTPNAIKNIPATSMIVNAEMRGWTRKRILSRIPSTPEIPDNIFPAVPIFPVNAATKSVNPLNSAANAAR